MVVSVFWFLGNLWLLRNDLAVFFHHKLIRGKHFYSCRMKILFLCLRTTDNFTSRQPHACLLRNHHAAKPVHINTFKVVINSVLWSENWWSDVQDYRGRRGGSVSRAAVSWSIAAGVGVTLMSLGVSWFLHRRRRRRAAAAAAEAADNDGRDSNSTDNAAFAAGKWISLWTRYMQASLSKYGRKIQRHSTDKFNPQPNRLIGKN